MPLKHKESFFLSPFYYSSNEEKEKFDTSYVSDLNLILPIPLVVWGRDKKGEDGDKRFRFILGYYTSSFFQRSVNGYFSKIFLEFSFIYGWRKIYRGFLFYFRCTGNDPILYSSQTTPNSYDIRILLFAGFKSDPESGIKLTMILPFWYQSENRDKLFGNDHKNFRTFTPVFFQTETFENWTNGRNSSEISRFYTILPLPMFYTFESKIKYGSNSSSGLVVEDSWGFDWLLFINYEKQNKIYFEVETQTVSENKTQTETKSVSLKTLFALYGYEKFEKFSNGTTVLSRMNAYLFPLFFYKNADSADSSSTYRWMIPILAYRSFQGNQDGAVISHTNLLGILFDYQRDDILKTNSVFFFPSIYYSNDQKNKDKTFFFLSSILGRMGIQNLIFLS
ncbi:hypothetical protein LEP1GSC088_0723 [Leptospira interrogans str. L1207]|nr:hypothetical protein LEP1GSC088_0723 [Leptospira interrogans str. L1207]